MGDAVFVVKQPPLPIEICLHDLDRSVHRRGKNVFTLGLVTSAGGFGCVKLDAHGSVMMRSDPQTHFKRELFVKLCHLRQFNRLRGH